MNKVCALAIGFSALFSAACGNSKKEVSTTNDTRSTEAIVTTLKCQVGLLEDGQLKNVQTRSANIKDGEALVEFDEKSLVEGLGALATYTNGRLLLAFELPKLDLASEVISDDKAENLSFEKDSKRYRMDCAMTGTGSIPDGVAPVPGSTGSIPEGIAPARK